MYTYLPYYLILWDCWDVYYNIYMEKRYSFMSSLYFRENKNRYVFSFLSALIDMDILSTVEMDFMLVGHTGNQVRVKLKLSFAF